MADINTANDGAAAAAAGGGGSDLMSATEVARLRAANAERLKAIARMADKTLERATTDREANAAMPPDGGVDFYGLVQYKKDAVASHKMPKDRLLLCVLKVIKTHGSAQLIGNRVYLKTRPAKRDTPVPEALTEFAFDVGSSQWAGAPPNTGVARGDIVRVSSFTAQASAPSADSGQEPTIFTNVHSVSAVDAASLATLQIELGEEHFTDAFHAAGDARCRPIFSMLVRPFDAEAALEPRGVQWNAMYSTKPEDYKVSQQDKAAVKGIQVVGTQWNGAFEETASSFLVTYALWAEQLAPFHIASTDAWVAFAPALLPLVHYGLLVHVNRESSDKMVLNSDPAAAAASAASGGPRFGLATDAIFLTMDTRAEYARALMPVNLAFVRDYLVQPAEAQRAQLWKQNAGSHVADGARRVICLNEYGGNALELAAQYAADPSKRVEFRATSNAMGLSAEQIGMLQEAGVDACSETLRVKNQRERSELPQQHIGRQVIFSYPGVARFYIFMLIWDVAAPLSIAAPAAAAGSGARMEIEDVSAPAAAAPPALPPRPAKQQQQQEPRSPLRDEPY